LKSELNRFRRVQNVEEFRDWEIVKIGYQHSTHRFQHAYFGI